MRWDAAQSQGIAGIGAGFAFAQQMNNGCTAQEPVVKEVIRIKCPNCGELNKEDAKFCCGAERLHHEILPAVRRKWRPTVSSAVPVTEAVNEESVD
ncbi:MAG: hypothetical protein ACLRL6_04220 [Clostridium sp.]